MATRREYGAFGERVARQYLERQGFVFRAKNVRTPFGELDLIMRDGNCLVFCEVKFRRTKTYGLPETAITARKFRHLSNAMLHVLSDRSWRGPFRLDVIAITQYRSRMAIRHFRSCGARSA